MSGVVPGAGHLRNISDEIAKAFTMVAPRDYDEAAEEAALAVADYIRDNLGFEVDQ